MREIFGKQISIDTVSNYPDKINIEDFRKIIIGSFDSYTSNKKVLNELNDKNIEEWAEDYLLWLGIYEESIGPDDIEDGAYKYY